MKRYMMILTLALLLGGCIYPRVRPCNFCVTKPPPSDLGTILDGSIYRRATSTPTHAPSLTDDEIDPSGWCARFSVPPPCPGGEP